jgi:hypothetical protein
VYTACGSSHSHHRLGAFYWDGVIFPAMNVLLVHCDVEWSSFFSANSTYISFILKGKEENKVSCRHHLGSLGAHLPAFLCCFWW